MTGPPGIQGGGGGRAQPSWAAVGREEGAAARFQLPPPDPGSQLCCYPQPLNELSERPSHLPRTHVTLLTLHGPRPAGQHAGVWAHL